MVIFTFILILSSCSPQKEVKNQIVNLLNDSQIKEVIALGKENEFIENYRIYEISPNVFIIQSNGTFYDSKKGIIVSEVLKKFYSSVNDKYDFVAILTVYEGYGDTAGIVKSDIKGVGLQTPIDNRQLFGLKTSKLLGFTITNNIDKYIDVYTNIEPILFELYHYWAMYLGDQYNCDKTCKTGLKINRIGHWDITVDTSTFEAEKRFVDPAGGGSFKDNNDGTFTYIGTSTPVNGDTARFSDVTLYLMGLLHPSKVNPATIFIPHENLPESFSTAEDIGKKFNGTKRLLTIDDLISLGGERIPSYENSQKKFSMAFVLVLDQGQDASEAQIQKMKYFGRNFPIVWNKATRGLSTLNGE
ncbi:hypothetical protein HYX00_00225 [Candidatus Woesearchaeota archaeon]|nr:hypothetical protein [Candidatus Woesearchaeota archaeon]